MDLYFITNRNEVRGKKGSCFGDQTQDGRGYLLNYGYLEDKTNPDEIPKECITDTPEEVRNLMARVQKSMREGKQDTVLYIHGFRNNFADAVSGARQFSTILASHGFQHNMCLISWPSDRTPLLTMLNYQSDRDDAKYSGLAVGRAFQYIIDFLIKITEDAEELEACERNIHLVCHSMGNYVLRHALQKIIQDKGLKNLNLLFKEVIMVAADEDSDVFEHERKLKYLELLCRRITVYHNEGDWALWTSDKTKFNPERLGDTGPRNTQVLSNKINTIDCTDVIHRKNTPKGTPLKDRISEHCYHLNVPKIQKDITATLQGYRSGSISGRTAQLHKGKGVFLLEK